MTHPTGSNIRRALLRGALAGSASLVLPRFASAQTPPPARLAAIDWAALETVLALGVAPVAATELRQFRKIAVEPVVPERTTDIGLRGNVNYELLRLTGPDLILISPFYAASENALARIAPVLSLPFYTPGVPPFEPAVLAMQTLGARLHRQAQAEAYVAATRTHLQAAKHRLAGIRTRPLYVVSLGDARFFRAFGADSMFGDVLARLGLDNAWRDETSYSAAAPVAMERLADTPDAILVIVDPTPPDVWQTLSRSAIWAALPAVEAGRVVRLPPINHYGGLPAARRFTQLLTRALARLADSAGG